MGNGKQQMRIFAKNLNFYIKRTGKQQNKIAEELGFPPTTFNSWCTGTSFPQTGKIQAIADYFGILKSDLIEERDFPESAFEFVSICMKIAKSNCISDHMYQNLTISYHNWPQKKKDIFCEYLKEFNILDKGGD